jgi:hypothetical protein
MPWTDIAWLGAGIAVTLLECGALLYWALQESHTRRAAMAVAPPSPAAAAPSSDVAPPTPTVAPPPPPSSDLP